MTDVKRIGAAEWQETFGQFGDYNYENSPTYLEAIAARSGAQTEFVQISRDGKLLGGAAIRVKLLPLVSRGVAYVSSGPMVRGGDGNPSTAAMAGVLAALRDEYVMRRKLIMVVRPAIAPQQVQDDFAQVFAAHGFAGTDIVRRYLTVLVDLSLDEAKLRSNLSRTWRLRLNQSDKADLQIEVGTSRAHWDRFLAVYRSMREMKTFESDIGPDFFSKLDLERAGVVMLFAQHQGKDVGAVVLSVLGDTAIYVYAATDAVGRDKRAGYKMNWEAMKYLKANGRKWYDLGGVDVDDNEGGYAFKTRIGGALVQAAGPYKAVPGDTLSKLTDAALGLRQRLRKRPAPPPVRKENQDQS